MIFFIFRNLFEIVIFVYAYIVIFEIKYVILILDVYIDFCLFDIFRVFYLMSR